MKKKKHWTATSLARAIKRSSYKKVAHQINNELEAKEKQKHENNNVNTNTT